MMKSDTRLRDNQAFRALLGGSSVSMLGSRVSTIAYPMLVLYLTRSPIDGGFAVFATTAPSVVIYVPAGALVDRWDPRRTMLCSEMFRGLAVGTIVGIVLFYRSCVLLLVGLAVIEEILGVFATLAERRCMGMLVEPEFAASASARVEARTHVIVLFGRPLGALLFEIWHVLPFLADLVSFIISCLTLIGIRGKTPISAPQHLHARLREEIYDGLRWLKHDRFVRVSIILSSCMTFISQALMLVFIAESESRHLSALAIGSVLACSGFGGAVGAIFGKVVGRVIVSRLRFVQGCSRIKSQPFVWSAGLLALAVSFTSWRVPCMSIVLAIFGFSGALGNIELDTYITKNVPQEMLGRLTSILRQISSFMFAVGPAAGGVLVGCFGTDVAIWCLFAVAIALTALVARNTIKRGWHGLVTVGTS